MTSFTTHEQALIREYEGDEALLQKLTIEYMDGVSKWVKLETNERTERG